MFWCIFVGVATYILGMATMAIVSVNRINEMKTEYEKNYKDFTHYHAVYNQGREIELKSEIEHYEAIFDNWRKVCDDQARLINWYRDTFAKILPTEFKDGENWVDAKEVANDVAPDTGD